MEVEVWPDVACPWCHVAKRRLDLALAELEHADAVTPPLRPEAQHESEGVLAMAGYGVTVGAGSS